MRYTGEWVDGLRHGTGKPGRVCVGGKGLKLWGQLGHWTRPNWRIKGGKGSERFVRVGCRVILVVGPGVGPAYSADPGCRRNC